MIETGADPLGRESTLVPVSSSASREARIRQAVGACASRDAFRNVSLEARGKAHRGGRRFATPLTAPRE
jgi:hypothetical protein